MILHLFGNYVKAKKYRDVQARISELILVSEEDFCIRGKGVELWE
jgi:hypothetical protein